MVLEQLVSTRALRERPLASAALAVVLISSTIIATRLVFPLASSAFTVAFAAIALIPAYHHLLRDQETAQERRAERPRDYRVPLFFAPLVKHYAVLFVAALFTFTLWLAVLSPADASSVFALQQQELAAAVPTLGLAEPLVAFETLFLHNARVLLAFLVLALLYSAGAIFLILWIASLFAVAFQAPIQNAIASYAWLGALAFPLGFAHGFADGALAILPHGALEFLAFFLTAVAGGTLSLALEHRHRPGVLPRILLDTAKLVGLSILLLAAGALVESLY